MKKLHSLTLILLTAVFFAHAQTAENPNKVDTLKPLVKEDLVVYKSGFRGPPRVEYPGDIFGKFSGCHSDIDFDLNIEFARTAKGTIAIFLLSVGASELLYEQYQDKVRAMNDYFVRVRNAEKTIDGGFEGEIVDLTEIPVLAADTERKIVVRRLIELPPGRYRADTTFRDRNSGCRGRRSKAFTVPELEKGNLRASIQLPLLTFPASSNARPRLNSSDRAPASAYSF